MSWSVGVILIFAGFGLLGFMFISLTPLVLQWSHTIQSLVTPADMWSVVIRVFLYHQKVIFQKSECTCGFIQWRIQEFILHVYQLELQIWEC
ncbi:putative solute carrier family 35 member SLC35F1/F2/F6 [Helianthus anomalus]